MEVRWNGQHGNVVKRALLDRRILAPDLLGKLVCRNALHMSEWFLRIQCE
jgi:hypothetical protein